MDVRQIKIKEKEARVYHFKAEVTGEVRKVTLVDGTFEKEGKVIETKKLEIALDDQDEERFYLYDKDLSHAEELEKGKTYVFTIRIDCDETWDNKDKSHKIFVIGYKEV